MLELTGRREDPTFRSWLSEPASASAIFFGLNVATLLLSALLLCLLSLRHADDHQLKDAPALLDKRRYRCAFSLPLSFAASHL